MGHVDMRMWSAIDARTNNPLILMSIRNKFYMCYALIPLKRIVVVYMTEEEKKLFPQGVVSHVPYN